MKAESGRNKNKALTLNEARKYPYSREKDFKAENIQKQPSRGVLKEKYSENMQQIYRKTLMPKCNFSKVALQGQVFFEVGAKGGRGGKEGGWHFPI